MAGTTTIVPGNTPYVGKEQITGLSTTKSLTPPSNARWAILKPKTQGIYVNLGAITTVTSADMLISADISLEVTSALADVRIIEAVASATVDVWYFG